MQTPTDWQLVEETQNGHTEAFAELVRRHQQHVVHFCWRMVGSRQDAEDLAQESFIRLYGQLGRLRPRAQFTTYLFAIARNTTLNHLRSDKRRGRDRLLPLTHGNDAPRLVADQRPQPDRSAQLREADDLVQQALQRLSPEHREIVVLREMQGLDYDAIAAVLGCRRGTVKSRLSRAREQLRADLAPHIGELLHEH
jgi:RNA polymerase sigma-70 factor (ECF subfamily)